MATEAALVATRLAEARDTGILDLSNCKLVQLPTSIYIFIKDTTITICNLSNNQLKSLPQRLFQECTNLKELNLSNNQLQMIPNEIIQLQRLEILDFSCNSFTRIPISVYQLEQLKQLKVQDNQIEDINMELLSEMKSLERISLEDNPLNEDTIETLQSIGHQLTITL